MPTKAYVLSADKLHEMEARDPQLANALHRAIVSLLAERLTANNGLLQRLIDYVGHTPADKSTAPPVPAQALHRSGRQAST